MNREQAIEAAARALNPAAWDESIPLSADVRDVLQFEARDGAAAVLDAIGWAEPIGYAIAATASTGYVWAPHIAGHPSVHQSLGVVQDALTATTAENYTLCALVPVEES